MATSGGAPPTATAAAAATTTAPLDPSTLTSWETAFQTLPLPQILTLSRTLRSQTTQNREKLRSLVGGSYRSLLSTAERIIVMDEGIKQLEEVMGDVGRGCNSGVVERGGRNYGGLVKSADLGRGYGYGEGRKMGVLAQIKVLKGVVAFTGRVVRKGGDALVGAKVCVLGRLIWKSVNDEVGRQKGGSGLEYAALLDDLRKKLAVARKRLLNYVARSLVQTGQLAKDGTEEEDRRSSTVQTLCAYSLLTSSAPKDVLRYFLQVRFEQLESRAETTPSEETLLEMLELYSETLLITREVFPRRFGDALSQMSRTSLVKDGDVKPIVELSLDTYGQWLADDVRNFQPWVRHDQISSSEVVEAISSWSQQAQACVLQGVSASLQEQTNVDVVLDLRRNVIAKYLSLRGRIPSGSHAQAIVDLRKAFSARLEDLARQAAKIPSFDLTPQSLENAQAAALWDLAKHEVDQDRGAFQYRKTIIARQHGRDGTVDPVITAMNDWSERLGAFSEAIAVMKSTRWDEDLDFDLDDLSDDAPIQDVLNKQDPKLLESTLQTETAFALSSAYATIAEPDSTRNPVSLVRILREIDSRRQSLADMLDTADSLPANQSFIADLHGQIATSVGEASLDFYTKRLRRSETDTSGVWDGTPPLPIQPAPGTFRFLKMLHRDMSDMGSDIWSPEAVRSLKIFADASLSQVLANESDDVRKPEALTNGHAAVNDADPSSELENAAADKAGTPITDTSRPQNVQRVFDVMYLQRALRTTKQASKLQAIVEKLQDRIGLNAAEAERLSKSADDYWKRTYLLFGLLAETQGS